MAKKQIKNNYKLEKVLTFAGLGIIALGFIANMFGAFSNIRFVGDIFDVIYYFRYVLLLVGGLAIGFLFTKKSAISSRWLNGVVYAVFAITLYMVLDIIRVVLQNSVGFFPFPWGKVIFEGEPLIPLVILVLAAFTLRFKLKRPIVNTFVKVSIITSLVLYQVYILLDNLYYLSKNIGEYDSSVPVWLAVSEYLTTPLVVAFIAYLVLGKIKKTLDRIFFSVLIAAFYSILMLVLWEFRIDPSSGATYVFGNIVTGLSLLFVGVLLWRAQSK